MERIKGAYGIILTPYKPDGSIYYNEMQRQVDYVCRTGIRGLVACGSTGECAQLSPQVHDVDIDGFFFADKMRQIALPHISYQRFFRITAHLLPEAHNIPNRNWQSNHQHNKP